MALALAANDLSFKFTLEKFGDKSLLFVTEGHSTQVTKGGLSKVVKQREEELLRIALFSQLEHSIADALNHHDNGQG